MMDFSHTSLLAGSLSLSVFLSPSPGSHMTQCSQPIAQCGQDKCQRKCQSMFSQPHGGTLIISVFPCVTVRHVEK